MKKGLYSALICIAVLAVCVLFLPTQADAATSGYYTYTVTDGEATITSVSTNISGNVTIPSKLGGYPVTAIYPSAFYECYSLKSVTIPSSITSIGDYAFERTGLTRIWVNTNNPNYSSDDYGVLYNKDKTTLIRMPECRSGSYTIPSSVTAIEDSAFLSSDLTSVTIPFGIVEIPTAAFRYSNLKSVVIPDSVTSIGNWAFRDCYSLTSVTIPVNVKQINCDAFAFCGSLKTIIYKGTNRSWNRIIKEEAWDLDVPYTLKCLNNKELAYSLSNDRTYTIVTGIGSFEDSNLIIPSTILDKPVKSIGERAFYNCNGLAEIKLPDSVTSIGGSAFENCSSLTSVTLPDSVTSIGDYAFYDCSSLTSITIPDSVTSIGQDAFNGCSSLKDVYYCGTEIQWRKISIYIGNQKLTGATIHYICKSHSYGAYTYTDESEHSHTCTVCGHTETVPHTWNNGEITLKPTEEQTGIKTYTCTVCGAKREEILPAYALGDLDHNGKVDNKDVEYLLWYTLFPEDYVIIGNGDLDGDGYINNKDVEYLLWHTLFPEDYPL